LSFVFLISRRRYGLTIQLVSGSWERLLIAVLVVLVALSVVQLLSAAR